MPELLSRADAAAARSLKIRSLADRPSQRRVAERAGRAETWTPEIRAQVEIRAAGENAREFNGFASVTGRHYRMWDMFGEYEENVAVGAFAETLAQHQRNVEQLREYCRTESDRC